MVENVLQMRYIYDCMMRFGRITYGKNCRYTCKNGWDIKKWCAK